MENKHIVFTAPGKAELLDCAIAQPGAGEVLVRLVISTISSGTERANVSGEINVSVHAIHTTAHFPRYAGYSAAGIVEQTGMGVTKVKPGDRVVVSWGSHSRYICVKENNVHKIEAEEVSFHEAALSLIGTFPLAAIRKCRLEIGEAAIVMGQGILGMIGVKLLRAAGACPIIAVDPIAAKREAAIAYGADTALDPFSGSFAKRAIAHTHGGANVALEVTGSGKALDGLLDCMKRLGRVALLGCTRNADFTIDYYHKVHGPGISLIGAHTHARPQMESAPGLWTHHDDIMALLRLAAAGRIRLASLVEEVHSPVEAPLIYRRLMTEPSFPVIQFDWSLLA